MRVLHLATADHGGAGTAAVRLHQALGRAGATSRMIVWSRQGTAPGVEAVAPQRAIAQARRFLARAWNRLTTRRAYYFQNQRLSLAAGSGLIAQATAFRPDLIVIHNLSNFLSFADVRELQAATGARVAWNLLDMGLLTGGCHYAWDCEGYQRACGSCPALPFRPSDDASARTLREKRAAIAAMDQVVAAGSSTLHRQARASALFRTAETRTILIGIDPDEFPWAERGEARARLDARHDGQILFFGAQNLGDARKGMRLLLDALPKLRASLPSDRPLPLLLVAGDATGLAGLDDAGFPVQRLGYLDRQKLALAYAAADFFICPSVEDSGPAMVNESLMAGTPVVAFEIGVVPDLIVNGVHGIIAEDKSAEALANALAEAVRWDRRRCDEARAACRRQGLEKCALEHQAGAYLEIARQ